jgi:hypothetical protein
MKGITKQKYESLTQRTRGVSVFNGKKYDPFALSTPSYDILKDKNPGGSSP